MNLTRRQFMGSAAAVSLTAAARGAGTPLVFGVIADAQYADVDPKGSRFYRGSLAKIRAAAEEFNRRGVAFVLNLGDTIDRDFASFDAALAALHAVQAPVHHVLGNHDFEVDDAQKAKVPAKLGLKARHTSFAHGGVRFLMLDGTELGPVPHPAGSDARRAADERVAALKARGLKQAVPWGGGIGADQFAWMERECDAASKAGERVVCACHYPVWPEGNAHNLFNDAEVRALAVRRGGIAAWFAGHDHKGNFGAFGGVPCLTFRGMVETADTNAFAVVTVHGDRMDIAGFGREPSRTLPFRT
jgi:hypothetical protein